MHVLYPRCCGLHIHQKTVVACVLLTDPDGTSYRFVPTVGTRTAEWLALGEWLRFHGVTHVAMESTGVLWRALAARLQRARGRAHAPPGQRAPPHSGPGAEDRRQGQPVVGRPAAPWAAAAELHPAAAPPGLARSHPLAPVARRTAYPGDQSDPQSTGDGHPQAGSRGQHRGGRQRTPDATGPRSRRV